jgi:CBS domain-containing protein
MAQGVKVGQITQMITLLNDRIVARVIEIVRPDHPETRASTSPGSPSAARAGTSRTSTPTRTTASSSRWEGRAARDDPRAAAALRRPGQPRARRDRLHALPGRDHGPQPRELPQLRRVARPLRPLDRPGHARASPEVVDLLRLPPGLGAEGRVEELRTWLLDKAAGNTRFQRQMAENALRNAPPLGGLFRDFRLSGRASSRTRSTSRSTASPSSSTPPGSGAWRARSPPPAPSSG